MYLEGLFGNATVEKVLLYLENYESGYASAIASTFDVAVSQVQKQLERLELDGILSSRMIGKTREYQFNPRYRFLKALRTLLNEAVQALPSDYQTKYFKQRQRPRRAGKPLP
ncbi:MAG: winged helix-turn-helix transcriptional regulator [Xanthomonadaceae bacterium]|nr:winged helix-turn-helix transcriptional regulator [Xanthomonadaceae bacterium]